MADPPWEYHSWPSSPSRIPAGAVFDGRRLPIKYPTMTVRQIAGLDVAELAEDDAHLYLWTTNRYLPDSFGVMAAWGFRYCQLLTWCKTPMGVGPGGAFAQNAEYIIFGRRGSPGQLKRVDSVWYRWPRTAKHSVKPEAFLDLVEQVSPGPYLELFARRQRLGWDTWGNECRCDVEMVARS